MWDLIVSVPDHCLSFDFPWYLAFYLIRVLSRVACNHVRLTFSSLLCG